MVKKYRIKLSNGRIVGPFKLAQIGELYSKGHIVGSEAAQVFPTGDWKKINQISDIKKLLQKLASGQKVEEQSSTSDSTIARISLVKKNEQSRKTKKENAQKEKLKKLEELSEDAQKEEHKEFKFTREEPSQLVDYDELEKKIWWT